jgi:hypothetical protein
MSLVERRIPAEKGRSLVFLLMTKLGSEAQPGAIADDEMEPGGLVEDSRLRKPCLDRWMRFDEEWWL